MRGRISRWYTALLADPDLPDAARVLGMDLAHSGVINERTGQFEWDMDAIAGRLNRNPTRIKERRAALRRARYLDIVCGHVPGRPTVWAIVIPSRTDGPSKRRGRPQPRGRTTSPGPTPQDSVPSPMDGDLVGVAL